MSTSNQYTTLPTGWGCSCPENRIIESKEECLAAAKELYAKGLVLPDKDNNARLELSVSENTWKYGPCGCFLWKSGRKLYYTGDRDDLHCVAVTWAELICRKDENDARVLASDIVDFPNAMTWVQNPEDSPRKCLDWFSVERLLHLKKNRDLCIGYDEDGDIPRRAILKRCDSLPRGLYYTQGKVLITNQKVLNTNQNLCLKTSGTDFGAVVYETCPNISHHPNVSLLYRFDFDNHGRIQNLGNGGYLGIEGCNAVENATVVTMNVTSVDECDFTQWLLYSQYNDTIPMEKIWTTVIPIYGTLLALIIGLMISGIVQRRRQNSVRLIFNRRQLMRPGVVHQTRAISESFGSDFPG